MTIELFRGNRAILASAFLAAGLALPGAALAQGPEVVTWTVSHSEAKAGERLALTVRGEVREGWHLYAFQQREDGPVPLKIELDGNAVATPGGAATGSKPRRERDAAFGFDTEFYAGPFTLTVPVRFKPDAKPGPQTLPLSVHFQTCNGSICHPPKTVRLTASVNLQAGR